MLSLARFPANTKDVSQEIDLIPILFAGILSQLHFRRIIIRKAERAGWHPWLTPAPGDSYMFSTRTRRIIGILILLISLVILIWGIWPFGHLTQTSPLAPGDLLLPTPASLAPIWVLI